MDPLLIAVAVSATAAILVALRWTTRERAILRELRRARARPIAELAPVTLAKVCGRARPHHTTLRAPMTGRRCMWFRLLVEEERSDVFNRSDWFTVVDEEEGIDFLLEDASGIARVAVRDAEAALVRDRNNRTKRFRGMPQELQAFLSKRGIPMEGSFGLTRKMRYSESALEPGELAAVLGSVRFEPVSDQAGATKTGGYRKRAERAVLESADEQILLLSDVPSAIDEESRRLLREP
jgi:hypothetical protein